MNARRTLIIGLALLMALTTAAPDVSARRRGRTIRADGMNNVYFGTNRDDRFIGRTFTGPGDVLFFGKRGNDRMYANSFGASRGGAGRDVYIGGDDVNLLYDSDGRPGDRFLGGDGPDLIISADGARDLVDCGPNTSVVQEEQVFGDAIDQIVNCDNVSTTTGGSIRMGANGDDTFSADPSLPEETVHLLNGSDTYQGSGDAQHVLLGGGADFVETGGGNDSAVDDDGTPGDDMRMGDGFDVVFAVDGARDFIDCGDHPTVGNADIAYTDPFDVVSNCETHITG